MVAGTARAEAHSCIYIEMQAACRQQTSMAAGLSIVQLVNHTLAKYCVNSFISFSKVSLCLLCMSAVFQQSDKDKTDILLKGQ